MKSLNVDCDSIITFPPGHFYTSNENKHTRYYNPIWFDHIKSCLPKISDELKTANTIEMEEMYSSLRNSLTKSVKVLYFILETFNE